MVFKSIAAFSSASIESQVFVDSNVVCMALPGDCDLMETPFETVCGDVRRLGLRGEAITSAFFFTNASSFLNTPSSFTQKTYLRDMRELKEGKKHFLSLDLSMRIQKKFVLLHFVIFYSPQDQGFGFLIRRLVGLEEQINGFYQRAQLDFTTGLLGKERCLGDLNSLKLDGKTFVVFIDLNNFKRVNDFYGHEVGDRILKSFAGALINQLPSHYSCYRFGGDEFVILGSHTTQEALSAFLSHAFSLFKSNTPYHIAIDFSAGVIRSYPFFKDHLCLLRCSDQAMYLAKKKKMLYYIMPEKEAKESAEKGFEAI